MCAAAAKRLKLIAVAQVAAGKARIHALQLDEAANR
jgi:hypothetical protein